MNIIIIQKLIFFEEAVETYFYVGEKMADDIKCLKILKDETSLKDIFKEEFLNKLSENFGELDVFPVGIALAVQKEDITEDIIQLTHRNDDEIKKDIVLIDIQNDYNHMSKIINSLK